MPIVAGVAIATLALLPGAAHAGAPGRWEAISGPLRGSSEDTTLLRTADGQLHVVWAQQGATSASLLHRTVAPNGRLGAPGAIVSGYVGVSHAALLHEGSGLRALFGTQRTAASGDPVQGLVTSASGNGGATWSTPLSTTPCCSVQGTHAGAVSAVRLADGTPLAFSSGTGFGIVAHRGLSPATPLTNYSDARPGYGTTLLATAARDQRSGLAVVAFQATAGARDGVWVQPIDQASGGPQGAPIAFPGLGPAGGGGGFVTSSQLTRIAARAGGGLFVAFSDTTASVSRTLLWRVGTPRPWRLGRGGGTHYVATAVPTPDGRVWTIWSQERAGKVRVVARRSNPQLTRFGEPVTIAAPRGTQRIFALDGSSQALRADIVATVGGSAGFSHRHTQLTPPLELSASPRSIGRGSRTRVRFTVTDVGVPVAGVKVRAAGASATTDRRGRAVLRLRGPRAGGRIRIGAQKAGYRSERLSLTVKRARRGR